MKKLKPLIILFALTSLTILTGCPPKSPEPGVRDFIKKAWKVTEAIQTVSGVTTTVYKEGTTPILEDFSTVRIEFTDGTNYKYTIGTTTTTGTYAFSANETAITFTGGGLDKVTYNIETPVSENLTDKVFNVNYSNTSNKVGPRTLKVKHVPA